MREAGGSATVLGRSSVERREVISQPFERADVAATEDGRTPLSTPLQIHDAAMLLVGLVEAPQFQPHSAFLQRRVDPPGRVALAKEISHGRQGDQVNAAGVLLQLPSGGA